jgi:hypothetical protein
MQIENSLIAVNLCNIKTKKKKMIQAKMCISLHWEGKYWLKYKNKENWLKYQVSAILEWEKLSLWSIADSKHCQGTAKKEI